MKTECHHLLNCTGVPTVLRLDVISFYMYMFVSLTQRLSGRQLRGTSHRSCEGASSCKQGGSPLPVRPFLISTQAAIGVRVHRERQLASNDGADAPTRRQFIALRHQGSALVKTRTQVAKIAVGAESTNVSPRATSSRRIFFNWYVLQ